MNNIFTFFLVIFQLLFLYATAIPSVSVADIILLFMYPILIISLIKRKRLVFKKCYLFLLFFFIYVMFQFAFLCFVEGSSFINEAFLRTGRFLFYLFTVIFLAPHFFNIRLGTRILKYVCLISTCFLFFQLLMVEFANIYIPGTIPELPIMRADLAEFNQNIMEVDFLIRPRSFFAEPAHYASYVILYLALGLFSEKNTFKDFLPEIIISIGLLVSNSATGIITGIIVWILFIFHTILKINSQNKKNKFLLPVLIGTPITIICIMFTNYFQIFLTRVLGSGLDNLGSAAIGRFGNYKWAFSLDGLALYEILFGRGMVEIEKFIPAIAKLFYYYGLVGIILFFIMLLIIIFKAELKQKVIIILIFILSIGGDAIFGPNSLYYLLFFMNDKIQLVSKNELR